MRPRPRTPSTLRLSAIAVAVGLFVASAGPAGAVAAPSPEATKFTIIHVPDTQNEVVTSGTLLTNRYQWIVNRKTSENIAFVVHTGDLVNWGVADPVQFTRASDATKLLDNAGIAYAYAVGNHDTAVVKVGGGAAAGDARTNLRNTTAFNKTFPVSRFAGVGGTFEPGKVDNMYQTFRAGGADWLVLTLEMWPRTSAITWAQGVLASHPSHNVIINTHVNIDNSGGRPTGGVYGDNNPQVVWDKLGSQYANVRMILSGHFAPLNGTLGAAYNTVTGAKGNKVLQVMTAYTSPHQNHVRTLTIDTKAMSVTSTVTVPMSNNSAYPSGKITDAASSFTVTGMGFKVGAAPTTKELLPDPGFEAGMGGWSAFNVGNMTRVSSPVRSGTYAMKITAVASSYQLVGMTQNTAVASSTNGKTYTATCYVRPSTANLEVRIRLLQYTANFGSNQNLGTTVVSTLPANTWTKVSVTGTATAAGQRIIPQVYASFQTTATGYLVYDDCSLT
ncbi:MAG: metallophosphoesterase [Micrococcales bacterium]|nr:metallophosphoesterase [Micrococcales bacterium]